ncbi:MAG: cell wall-binding repeat-containing protein [Peptostreptococcus sp.]|nr:cell wall-binding repeat-containing protein [Peptostreptococcus sp.]
MYNAYFKSAGVFPKYLLGPNETKLAESNVLNIDYRNVECGYISYLPSVGITKTYAGVDIRNVSEFYRFGLMMDRDYKLDYFQGRNLKPTDRIPAMENPFGFSETELLSQAEIKDPTKQMVYGDLKRTGSSDSREIGEYRQGDEVKLDFSMDASWLKRYIMGYTLDRTRGGMDEYNIQVKYNDMKGIIDSQVVYTLDIPNEVEAKDAKVKLNGFEDFVLTSKLEPLSATKKKLVINIMLKDSLRGKPELWKKTIEKIRSMDASDVKVSISGLYVKDTVSPGTTVSLRGTIGGYFDWALSREGINRPDPPDLDYYPDPDQPCSPGVGMVPTASPLDNQSCTGRCTRPHQVTENPCDPDNPYPNEDFHKVKDVYDRVYLYYVARQSDNGRDSAAPANMPYLISYSFQVKKKPDSSNPGRIDGNDRTDTAIKISKNTYDKAKTAIIVRKDLFPDSMTASVLARLKEAPILLNPTDRLDSRVRDEIKRLGVEEVIIVGGQNSISERVREDLRAFDKDSNVERIAGLDRYETSEKVARRVVGITGKKHIGVVASGQVFPDALSVGTFASRDGYPILLVKKDILPIQVERAIKDLEINSVYIAGGTNTISKATEAKLPRVEERMAGKDRYETSVAIARSKFRGSKEAFIASGEEFADALVISPISGKYNKPTLLVSRRDSNNIVVRNYIKDTKISRIIAIGGEKYLPPRILESLLK